jgi:uncharacterized protein
VKPVFLDTVGLLALWDVDDQWHGVADVAYGRVVSSRQSIVTTTFVLLECGNAASRRAYRENVCALRRTLELRGELIVPTDDDWNHAWEAYQCQQIAGAGIVDCVSFTVMQRLGIGQAFTNDRHFEEAGFERLF